MRWRIAILVSAAIAVSYLDRQTLPVAIKAISKDIPLSNGQFSDLQSAFLFAYALMYAGGGLGEAEGGTGGSAELGSEGGMTGGGTIVAASTDGNGTGGATAGGLVWATPAAAASTVTTLNEQILLAGEDDEPEPEAVVGAEAVAESEAEAAAEVPERVPVPALTSLAIALCTGVTVLFGVWPQPLIDFANHATLLFLPK